MQILVAILAIAGWGASIVFCATLIRRERELGHAQGRLAEHAEALEKWERKQRDEE